MTSPTSCPLCTCTDTRPWAQVRDHSVSGEWFHLQDCPDCGLRFTVSPPPAAEIGRYYRSENYVSHTDTREGLVNRLYHRVRKHTLRQKRRLVEQVTGLRNGRILDVGCGTGAFLHEMKASGWTVTGLEPDATASAIATNRYGLHPLPSQQLYQLAENGFDVITLWHVLEHVHDLHGYVEQWQRLLSPRGVVLVAVPNPDATDARHYGPGWAAYDVPRHLYHFNPRSMARLAQRHAFRIAGEKPMWFDSFYVSLLSEQYRSRRLALLFALFQGLRSNVHAFFRAGTCSSLIYIWKKEDPS